MGAQWKAKGKALVADAKGKLFGKLVKEITVAARGGADPASNARLRLVVGGGTRERTLDLVTHLRHDYGIEAMAHLTCVGASRTQLGDALNRDVDFVSAEVLGKVLLVQNHSVQLFFDSEDSFFSASTTTFSESGFGSSMFRYFTS